MPVTANPADYEFDVFLSYKRNSWSLEWIRDEFIGELAGRIEIELGRRPNIFWDDMSVDDGTIPTDATLHALRTSRLLLSILSGPYFESKWCTAEWETFECRAAAVGLTKGRTLTIPVRWSDGDRYLPLLIGDGPRPIDFTKFRIKGLSIRLTPAHFEYQIELDSLATTIVASINAAPPFDPGWPWIDPEKAVPRQPNPASWDRRLAPGPEQVSPAL